MSENENEGMTELPTPPAEEPDTTEVPEGDAPREAVASEPEPAETVADTAPDEHEKPKGVYIDTRKLLIAMAIVLFIVLIALIIYLLLMARPDRPLRLDEDPIFGLKAEMVIKGPGQGSRPLFKQPMGVAWSPDARLIHVADTENNRICTFDREGVFIREFGTFGIAKPLPGVAPTWNPGDLNYPTDLATDADGNVYVADFYNDSISVFSEEGEFLRRFPDPTKPVGKGSSGQEGKGIAVTAVTVDGDRVYATDTYQVFVFTLEGTLVSQFGRPGLLDHPNGVVVDPEGNVLVSDSNNNRMVSFSPEGEVRWTFGDPIPPGVTEESTGTLSLPRGATIRGDADSVLVADPIGQQIAELSLDGRMLGTFGTRGSSPAELNFPNDLDWHSGRILVADRANDRIQILRLVKK